MAIEVRYYKSRRVTSFITPRGKQILFANKIYTTSNKDDIEYLDRLVSEGISGILVVDEKAAKTPVKARIIRKPQDKNLAKALGLARSGMVTSDSIDNDIKRVSSRG